jgi:hypothetical protein
MTSQKLKRLHELAESVEILTSVPMSLWDEPRRDLLLRSLDQMREILGRPRITPAIDLLKSLVVESLEGCKAGPVAPGMTMFVVGVAPSFSTLHRAAEFVRQVEGTKRYRTLTGYVEVAEEGWKPSLVKGVFPE